jgi:magnesium transporter
LEKNGQQKKEAGVILLSELHRFLLVDAQGRQARPIDLTVDLVNGDYPPVNFVLFQNEERRQVALPWQAVIKVNYHLRRFEIDTLAAAQPASSELLAEQTLLRRDILDALVLDLENRRATRVNDLWLGESDGRLALRAADASLQAIFRRLTRGWVDRRPKHSLHDWKYIESLQGDPNSAREGAGGNLRIARMSPGEIASMIQAMPYLHAAELLKLLPDTLAADVLEMMTAERELQVFEELDDDQASRLLALMAPDAAADLIGDLHTEAAQSHLERLPAIQSERIIELLRYPEDSVGGIMTNDVVFVAASLTVRQAREVLRDRLKEPDFVYFVYVVDNEESRKLQGVITLRKLLVVDEERRLEEVMNKYVTTLDPLESARMGAERVLSSHLAALPVIGQNGRLIGVVTVDAAVAQVAPQSWSAQAPKVFS